MAPAMAVIALVVPFPAVFLAFSLSIVFATRPMMRHINIIIPPVTHEVDGSAASIILVAVLAPFFLMSGRNVQVNRLFGNACMRSNHDWFRINDFRMGNASDVNAAEKTGLTNADRHADVGGVR